ncbi:hypothetical protein BDF19DRAFT_433856 [Syncephalis fuscata]|nr:hypothetical protein BDF19DRAFT_433856 [Syncephalis fuscata]
MPNPYRISGNSGRSGRIGGSTTATTTAKASSSLLSTTTQPYMLNGIQSPDTADFCHLMLRTLASRIVARATPFTHLTTTSTQVLAELLALKLGQLGRTVKMAAEMAGRTQATLQDMAIALDRVGTGGGGGSNVDSEAGYGGTMGRNQGELRHWCLNEAETSVKAISGNAVSVLQQLVQSGQDHLSMMQIDTDVNPLESIKLPVEEPDHRPYYIPQHLPQLPLNGTTEELNSHSQLILTSTQPFISTTPSVTTTTDNSYTVTDHIDATPLPPSSSSSLTTSNPSDHHTQKIKRKRRHYNAEQADQLALIALQSADAATPLPKTIASSTALNNTLQFEVPETLLDDFMQIDYPGIFVVEDKPKVSVKHIKQPAPPPVGATVTGPQLSLITAPKRVMAAPMDTLFGPCELGKVPSVSDTVQHLMQPAVVARLVTNNYTIRGRSIPPPSSSSKDSTSSVSTPTIKLKSSQLSKNLPMITEEKSTKKVSHTEKNAPSVVNVVIPHKPLPPPSTPTPSAINTNRVISATSTKQSLEKKLDHRSIVTAIGSNSSKVNTPTVSVPSSVSTPTTMKVKPTSTASVTSIAANNSLSTVTSVSTPSTVSTPASTGLPKIRLKIGKISIGLPPPPSPSPVSKLSTNHNTITTTPLLGPSTSSTVTNPSTQYNDTEEVINCICDTPTIDHGRFMIACDQCAVWFHGECVGIGPEMAEEGAEWYCRRCLAKRKS